MREGRAKKLVKCQLLDRPACWAVGTVGAAGRSLPHGLLIITEHWTTDSFAVSHHLSLNIDCKAP